MERDGFVSLYQLLGLCYLANGDRVRAQQAWNKGLAIDSSNEKLLGYSAATTSFERSTPSSSPRVVQVWKQAEKRPQAMAADCRGSLLDAAFGGSCLVY